MVTLGTIEWGTWACGLREDKTENQQSSSSFSGCSNSSRACARLVERSEQYQPLLFVKYSVRFVAVVWLAALCNSSSHVSCWTVCQQLTAV
jgi:hypothetical protein